MLNIIVNIEVHVLVSEAGAWTFLMESNVMRDYIYGSIQNESMDREYTY